MSTTTQTSEELFIGGHELFSGLSRPEASPLNKEYWKESMCDSCETKLNLLTRKVSQKALLLNPHIIFFYH